MSGVTARALPSARHTPATSAELASVLQQCVAARQSVRIVGAGHWLDAGRPVAASTTLDVIALRGIVDYVPGDLTITALAGTTLAELQAVVAGEGQWIPLDPWGGDPGTLGATLATATAGPSSAAVGLPRDVVLGVEVATGTGELVRGGGRVVKNVAGFDLVRLMVGAWGTLGVITEASLRVRARPVCDETVAIELPGRERRDWLQRLRRAPLRPAAQELIDGPLARELGGHERPLLLVRFHGNEAAVAAQRATLAEFGELRSLAAEAWTALRSVDAAPGAVLRLSAPPSRAWEAWEAAERTVSRAGGWAHASLERGVVRLGVPTLQADALAELLGSIPSGLTRRFERLPADLWPALARSAVTDSLSAAVRTAFDPHHLLNPGILGELQPSPTAVSA